MQPICWNILTRSSANTNILLDSQSMVPGKTYIGILPGHTKPAFVRKRALDAGKPPGLLTQIFGCSKRAYSVVDSGGLKMFTRKHRERYYYDRTTDTYRPLAPATFASPTYSSGSGRVITSVQQTCSSCGKFRSTDWQIRHPLVPGVTPTPSVCRKCHGKQTSSEEDYPKRHHKYRPCSHSHGPSRHCSHSRRYPHRYAESTDDGYSSRECRTPPRRRRPCSREHIRPRSRSREQVRVIIANQAGDRVTPRRERTISSSTDGVRVIRRTEIIDGPKRSRSRSRLRSSHFSYIEDGARYIEDLMRPRYHSKPRSLSQVRYYDDDFDVPRPRSSGRVAFVDDRDDPVVIARPRSRLSRRRAMIFDGAADTGSSEQEKHDRDVITSYEAHGQVDSLVGVEIINETFRTSSDVSSSTILKANGNTVTLAETATSDTSPVSEYVPTKAHKSYSSQPDDAFTARTSEMSEQSYASSFQPSVEEYDSDHNAAPYPASPAKRKSVTFEDSHVSSSQHKAPGRKMTTESPSSSPISSMESITSNYKEDSKEPETPQDDRRRRYRHSAHSSTSEDTTWAPPPSSYARKLSEMLKSMQVTPPRGPTDYECASMCPGREHGSEEEYSPVPTPLTTPTIGSSGWEYAPQIDAQRHHHSDGGLDNTHDSPYHEVFRRYTPIAANYFGARDNSQRNEAYQPVEEKHEERHYSGYEPKRDTSRDAYRPYHSEGGPASTYDSPDYQPYYDYSPAGIQYYGPKSSAYDHGFYEPAEESYERDTCTSYDPGRGLTEEERAIWLS